MKKYKLLAVFFTLIFSASALGASICAIGNANCENDSGFFIVIRDCDGNVVETYARSRVMYVNGTQYEIPANGSLTTYQYEPSDGFSAGFYFTNTSYSGNATTANRTVKITIENASTIGGERKDVVRQTFSTNLNDNPKYMTNHYGKAIDVKAPRIDSNRPYYDAKYENTSSQSVIISLLVTSD